MKKERKSNREIVTDILAKVLLAFIVFCIFYAMFSSK
ncbi:hypothetical protein EDC17_100542 [Sphingobacterium alimentarium]|uniref:Uncharacterized protein n=1 Tax=Sphingobacterium alimentarium TaxID=797292 RepID=A0A4R3W063_9SPHI|nr:hypothetical protein EDC17_100542 [Sphingobacterium alimentarium]